MTRCVLSIGSNIGDRLARLQAVVDDLGDSVLALSPVYETDAWGGVDQEPFLNAVVVADDPRLDAPGWLRRAQAIEADNQRVRLQKWGPRTLDVDLVCCFESGGPESGGSESVGSESEVFSHTAELTLPHPFAHQRAFVLVPWADVEPAAELTVDGRPRPVRELIGELDPAERDGVRPTALVLTGPAR